MDLNVNHTIDATSIASQISQGVKDGVSQGFSNAIDKLLGAGSSQGNEPISAAATISNKQSPDNASSTTGNNIPAKTEGLLGQFQSLTKSAQDVVEAFKRMSTAQDESIRKIKANDRLAGFAQMSGTKRKQVLSELSEHEKTLAKQRLDAAKEMTNIYDERRSSNRIRNIGMGLLTGAGLAAVYQAGNIGQVMGSSAQSINAGANNYGQFTNRYYGSILDTQKNIGSSITTAGAMAAGSMFGLPGMLIGGAVAGAANLYMGSQTEKQKAYNQLALDQDLASYRLRAYGISGAGSESLTASGGFGGNVKVPLTDLQSYMKKTTGYGGYLPYVGEVASGTRLDIMAGMNTKQQAEYVKNTARLGQLTGLGVGDVSGAIGGLSAATGKNANETLNKMLSYQLQYGGDMKSNIGKIIQLIQTTGKTPEQAAKLAYQYQYNEPMLQQKIDQSLVTPTNRFTGQAYEKIISKMTGLKPDEFSSEYRKIIRSGSATPKDIITTQLMGQYFPTMGINPWVIDAGVNKGVPNRNAGGGIAGIPETEAQKSMNKMIEDALQNISTVNMSAGVVYLDTKNFIQDQGINSAKGGAAISNWLLGAKSPQNQYKTTTDMKNAAQANNPNFFDSGFQYASKKIQEYDREQTTKFREAVRLQEHNRSGTGTTGVNK